MPELQRVRWAEQKAPADFRAWWRYCTRLVAGRVASHDTVRNRAEFVALAFWMWEHGLEREAFTPREVAFQQARFVARLEELHPEVRNAPSHDTLVDACLAHVTTEMTRDDKNLIDAASLLRHGLEDPSRFDETFARLDGHHRGARQRHLQPQRPEVGRDRRDGHQRRGWEGSLP